MKKKIVYIGLVLCLLIAGGGYLGYRYVTYQNNIITKLKKASIIILEYNNSDHKEWVTAYNWFRCINWDIIEEDNYPEDKWIYRLTIDQGYDMFGNKKEDIVMEVRKYTISINGKGYSPPTDPLFFAAYLDSVYENHGFSEEIENAKKNK